MRVQEQYQQMIVDAVKSVESFINPQAYENTYMKDITPTTVNNNQEGAHHYIKQEDLQKLMNTPIHQ